MDERSILKTIDVISNKVLDKEILSPKNDLKPILIPISRRKPEICHYIGVSYGLTIDLFRFWKKIGFESIYIRQTVNSLTGEHTCIMLKPLYKENFIKNQWLTTYTDDFRQRFMSLSSMAFRKFNMKLSLVVLNPHSSLLDGSDQKNQSNLSHDELSSLFTPFDLKRLTAYTRRRVDFHMILDLVPKLAKLFFNNRVDFKLNFTQCAILNTFGLQNKSIEEIYSDFRMPINQILALFTKILIKFVKCFDQLEEIEERKKLLRQNKNILKPVKNKLFEELKEKKQKQAELLARLKLGKYQITGSTEQWENALKKKKGETLTIMVPLEKNRRVRKS